MRRHTAPHLDTIRYRRLSEAVTRQTVGRAPLGIDG
jgi:hypothetical protein